MCTGEAALCGWERGSSVSYTVTHIKWEAEGSVGRGQLRTQPSLNAVLYINNILSINHNNLRTILWQINCQGVNTKASLEDLEGQGTQHDQQTTATLQMPKEHVHGTAPPSTLASPHGSPVPPERTLRAQPCLSPFPSHWLLLQHLGQGSPLLPPFPNPHCRVGPLEEKISSDFLPTWSFACHPSLFPFIFQEGGATPPSAWILTAL